VSAQAGVGLLLALVSTTLTNLGYVLEHEAAAALPCLSLRRPLHSLALLLTNKRWVRGFATETGGFLFYAAALALAPLALVQSIAAGGVGVLAFASARITGRRLTPRESSGVLLAIVGLVALATSLAGETGEGRGGSTTALLAWLGATGALALAVASIGRRVLGAAVAYGVAGGLLFSIGDVATKVATEGGARSAFVLALVLGYGLGTALLQLGYQRGGALTVAGLATLLTTAVPIVAGTIVLHEPVPSGLLGGLRALAFVAVSAGAFLLAQPDDPGTGKPVRQAAA
jgi:drug/metabolite transporter (DMT)-like permease